MKHVAFFYKSLVGTNSRSKSFYYRLSRRYKSATRCVVVPQPTDVYLTFHAFVKTAGTSIKSARQSERVFWCQLDRRRGGPAKTQDLREQASAAGRQRLSRAAQEESDRDGQQRQQRRRTLFYVFLGKRRRRASTISHQARQGAPWWELGRWCWKEQGERRQRRQRQSTWCALWPFA